MSTNAATNQVEFDEVEFDDEDPMDQLSEAEHYEIEQREIFNDRYQAWRNEY